MWASFSIYHLSFIICHFRIRVIFTANSDTPSPTRVTCSAEHLPALVGPHDQNLRVLEDALSVHIQPRDQCVEVSGEAQAAEQAAAVLAHLLAEESPALARDSRKHPRYLRDGADPFRDCRWNHSHGRQRPVAGNRA